MSQSSSSDLHRLAHHLKHLTQISLALSRERDINRLLEMILSEARSLSNADAGTLYILDNDQKKLKMAILQNDTLQTRMGGTSGHPVTLPAVALYHADGRPNHDNVSSHAALAGQTINIPDVYKADGFDFTGPRQYDKATGYRSQSMLVIPMRNHLGENNGVLQLLNAIDRKSQKVVPFSDSYVDLIAALASQAAVALTNTQLIQELQDLFYAFSKSIATALDEKSPFTGGHIRRVVSLVMMIVEAVNATDSQPFQDVVFSQDEMEELRLAAWMHDVGKIAIPYYLIDKATKLQAFCDRMDGITTRFHLLAREIENRYLRQKLVLLQQNTETPSRFETLDQRLAAEIKDLYQELAFVQQCNLPTQKMDDTRIKRLQTIARRSVPLGKDEMPLLRDDELKNLSVRRGNLSVEERRQIENHARMTQKILTQLPFPRQLSQVPLYAGAHHERLDGSGYPHHLTAADLPLQSRIMAIADIFEALTAKDRPYKSPMKLSEAIEIMRTMAIDGHIDTDLFDLFISKELHWAYAQKEMAAEQIDMQGSSHA